MLRVTSLALLCLILLIASSYAEEVDSVWKNADKMRPLNARVSFLAISDEQEIVHIKSCCDGLVTYVSLMANFSVVQHTEPLYKFKTLHFDPNMQSRAIELMRRVYEHFEVRIPLADSDKQVDFLKGFCEFISNAEAYSVFFKDMTEFFTRSESLQEILRRARPENRERFEQMIMTQYRFYASFSLFSMCGLDEASFKKIVPVVGALDGPNFTRLKRFVGELSSRREELEQFFVNLTTSHSDFTAHCRRMTIEISALSAERFDAFFKLYNFRANRENSPERPRPDDPSRRPNPRPTG